MRDLTERKIGGDLAEEQSRPKKPTLVRPIPVRAPANVHLGVGSSFQAWQKPFGNINGLVIAEAGSSATKPYHQLATSSNSAPAENYNNQNIENSTPDHPSEENPTSEGGAASGDATDDNTAKTDEDQTDQPGSDCNTKQEMDPRKLKRIISNRLSAQRSRLKKNAYVEDLESKAKSYQEKIVLLHRQIAAQKNKHRLLQIEQHKLKLHMAAFEKERILQEVAIEKNRAEVDRLRELLRKSAAEAQARMHNVGASVQLMSNTNLNPSGLGRLVWKNYSDQALNGVETSRTQVHYTAQQPHNQSQIAKWDNRLRSIPNFNLVKSEPES